MALFTFSGGVHPADGKEFAKNSPITEYLPKGDVVLPLGQHIGAPAQPIVSKGDQVLVGQKVAEAGGFVSANIFSSVSGISAQILCRIFLQLCIQMQQYRMVFWAQILYYRSIERIPRPAAWAVTKFARFVQRRNSP